jgi:threonylcarbamoyladenosine tRNA methylthiotransferase MtaB
VESEAAARYFSDAGFEVVYAQKHPPRPASLAVVNTCTVTTKAEQKCRRTIRALLAEHPNAAVLVTGCYAQMDAEKIAAIDPRVVVLRGGQKELLADVPSLLGKFFASRRQTHDDAGETAAALNRIIAGCPPSGDSFRLDTDTFVAHSRPSLKIQDGCDNECAFCRIRLARGKARSLAVGDVLARVGQLERAGEREVALTGVNLSQYSGAFDGKDVDLAALAALCLKNTSAIALRLSSLYPECIDDALCAVFSDPRIRPHFHLSVQAGSDSVLSRMNRPYTRDAVVRAVTKLRAVKDNPFVACDIIVGFPGETDDDFESTLALCRECDFAWIHAFPFSPRPGTPAFSMKDALPRNVVRERVEALTRLAADRKIAYIGSCAGRVVSAIIERGGAGDVRAVTENFLHVTLGKIPRRGGEIRARILYPLEDEIARGGEVEARAEIIEE